MKKIINGKLYNTDTAKNVGCWDNGLGCRDFACCAESLYQKRTGEFFLYGEGGPQTKYAERVGNMYAGGEDIIPLTEDEAKEWAERKLDADEYIAIFGEVEE